MKSIVFLPAFVAVLSILSACAPSQRQITDPTSERADRPYEIGDIVDLNQAGTVSFDRLMDRIQDARVIYLGETHVSRSDHEFQQRVIRALCDRSVPVTVAMEMFSRDTEEVLDRWSRGELKEKDFIEQSRWQQQWGYRWELYRGIFATIRDCRLKLIGLNLPHEVVSKVARQGLASLTPAERRLIASDLDLHDVQHRNRMEREFSAHPGVGLKDFESFYEAQLAWEETMAERLAQALETTGNHHPILVIIGKGHINRRFGVPERTQRRIPHDYKAITSVPLDAASQLTMGAELADYALVTDNPQFFHRPRALLGVMLEPLGTGHGFRIVRLTPHGAAAEAGLRTGDELLRIDGHRVATVADVRQAISGYPGYHTLLVRRSNQVLTLVARIRDEEKAQAEK